LNSIGRNMISPEFWMVGAGCYGRALMRSSQLTDVGEHRFGESSPIFSHTIPLCGGA
jgi:hypothetical protein